MTLTIELKPEIETLLVQKAKASDCAVIDYVEDLIEKDVKRHKTFDEIFAPLRKEVAESGISEDELDELFTQARREYFAEKKAKKLFEN